MRTPENQLTFSLSILLSLSLGVAASLKAADVSSNLTNTIAAPALSVLVDPRVELTSIIFRLAGNPEYNQGRVESYTRVVHEHFDKFREHELVKLAAELRRSRGVSFDAVMGMAVHLTDAVEPRLRLALSPWPDGLDRRWPAGRVDKFLKLTRQFVKDTSFGDFLRSQEPLYQMTETRMRALVSKDAHLEWFQQFYGEKAEATFTLALGLLNGGGSYGAHLRDVKGREELYSILGVWQTDARGLPEFSSGMLGTLVHEFSHSYANPVVDRHLSELHEAGRKLYGPVAEAMRSQAYGDGDTLLRESLVRACEVRYHHRYEGAGAARRAIAYEKSRSFLWTEELASVLAEYEGNRPRYPTLESFTPRLVAFFNEYAATFEERQNALAAKRPKVLALVPANGSKDVAPGLTMIRVTFDRPMRDGGWSMCGGGPHFPELLGKPHYDVGRTNWSVEVRLKPEWQYEFWLNSGQFDSFQSAEDVPLNPVKVEFSTGR